MRLEEIRFRAGGILDFRRLGILPWVVVFTSYASRHRIFLSFMCLLMCLAIGYEVSGIWFVNSFIPVVTKYMGDGTPAGQRL